MRTHVQDDDFHSCNVLIRVLSCIHYAVAFLYHRFANARRARCKRLRPNALKKEQIPVWIANASSIPHKCLITQCMSCVRMSLKTSCRWTRRPGIESKTVYLAIRLTFFSIILTVENPSLFFKEILKHFDRAEQGNREFEPRLKSFISSAYSMEKSITYVNSNNTLERVYR